MSTFSIKRLAVLPEILEPSTLYITKSTLSEQLVNLTFTGSDGTEVRHTLGEHEVQAAVDAAIAALSSEQIPDLPGYKITSAVAEATKLAQAFTINGVDVDGSQDVTIPAEDTATPRVKQSDVGVTVAPLVNGTIPLEFMPGNLDNFDVFPTRSDMPEVGDSEVIYVTSDDERMYRWTGESYVNIPGGAGMSDAAVRLAVARKIQVTGAVTGEALFDGTENAVINVTLEDLTVEQIPDLPGEKITTPVGAANSLVVIAEW